MSEKNECQANHEGECHFCHRKFDGKEVKQDSYTLGRAMINYKEEYSKLIVCTDCAFKKAVDHLSSKVFKPFFDAFSSEVNSMGYENDKWNVEAAVDGFVRQHRTLQSTMLSFTRLFLKRLSELAEKEPGRFTDLRNEKAILDWAKKAGSIDWMQPNV